MNDNKKLAMIAAVGPNLELGSNGDLVWHISADLKNFKRLTVGHPVIMGRKTWESLPKRPLPGRLNVIVSRSPVQIDGAVCVSSPEEALKVCEGLEMPFVIGGAQIYKIFMPLADVLYLTYVDAETEKEIDCHFPEYRQDWVMRQVSEWETDPKGIRYRFEEWERK